MFLSTFLGVYPPQKKSKKVSRLFSKGPSVESSLRNMTNITLFQEEELKDERVISVIVGVPASVDISVDKDLTELKVDETVTVECITVSEGNPPVSVNLYHEQKGEESQHLGDGSMVEYSPTLADTGSGNDSLEK